MAKSWVEKRDIDKECQVKTNPKKFADIPAGAKMLIPTPKIVDKLVKRIPDGSFLYLKQIRKKRLIKQLWQRLALYKEI